LPRTPLPPAELTAGADSGWRHTPRGAPTVHILIDVLDLGALLAALSLRGFASPSRISAGSDVGPERQPDIADPDYSYYQCCNIPPAPLRVRSVTGLMHWNAQPNGMAVEMYSPHCALQRSHWPLYRSFSPLLDCARGNNRALSLSHAGSQISIERGASDGSICDRRFTCETGGQPRAV
jgi:hypothetical protein